MTTPLEKPVRRLLSIRRGLSNAEHVVTMTARGLELRQKGRRFTLTVPWSDILARAEHLAGGAPPPRDASLESSVSSPFEVRAMKLDDLRDMIGLGDLVCADCRVSSVVVSAITLGDGRHVYLCDDCLEGLRALIRKTRGRRPLSPRSRRALSFLARTPAQRGSYGDIAAAIGKYATNVILTLLERKLIEQRGEHVKTAEFSLTPAGVAAVDALELPDPGSGSLVTGRVSDDAVGSNEKSSCPPEEPELFGQVAVVE
jgi:hypothetical protein